MAQTTLRDYLQETEDAITAGRLDDAFGHCQQILAQFPESLDAQRLLGEVYLAQGRLEDALQCFDHVLMYDPENVVAYCSRALVCQKMSDIDTALDCYQQAYELSDGDGAIRKQFNLLSTQIGQPNFMYSRAGLARLYMRGDLFSHAHLEWEAVLSVTPDRLDARLGLLETYWREESDEKVAQLAEQIVQDMPECLKALLLFAYVVAPRNIQQAQNTLQRVQAFDPEMTMAQDLFTDAIARQPSHPFFMLWKKAPVMIDLATTSTQSSSDATFMPAFASTSQTAPADTLSAWSELSGWNSVDTLMPDRQQSSTPLESSVFSGWNNASAATNTATSDPWSLLEQNQISSLPLNSQSILSSDIWNSTPDRPGDRGSGATSNQVGDNFSQQSATEQPFASEFSWEQQPPFSDARYWDTDSSEPKEQEQPRDAYSWSSTLNNNSSSAPVWMSMLTGSETSQKEPVAVEPVVDNVPMKLEQSKEPEQSVLAALSAMPPASPTVNQVVQEPVITPSLSNNDASLLSWNNQQNDEEDAFGPAWLKALGATTMDGTEAEIPQDVAESTELDYGQARQPSSFWQQPEQAEEERADPVTYNKAEDVKSAYTWENMQSSQAMEPRSVWSPQSTPSFDDWTMQGSEVDESAILTTLESLEQDLYSQGFVQLEPNSLTSIAQSQEAAATETNVSDVPEVQKQEEEQAASEDDREDASLSSALAQLGLLSPSDPVPASPMRSTVPATPIIPVEPLEPASVSSTWPAEPSWAATWRATPQAPAASVSSVPMSPAVSPAPVAEPAKMTAARAEALLDSELEMTMKRPAVRLQGMTQRATEGSYQHKSASLASKGRVNERPVPGVQDNYANYREYLVRGYQHQLVGDYDEAMQEYRLIIRSAPELLSEVISNVRALLKLAPKYSAGYRVLGDAYMRQGEYLQAMEAYNKALTMAKKARN